MKVRVAWVTTSFFEGVVDVDHVDDVGDMTEMNAALDAAETNLTPAKQKRSIGWWTVEDSRNVVLPDVKAVQHEPEWKD